MRKSLSQIRLGDLLLFAGVWHAVTNITIDLEYGMLYFKRYPPVVVRVLATHSLLRGASSHLRTLQQFSSFPAAILTKSRDVSQKPL